MINLITRKGIVSVLCSVLCLSLLSIRAAAQAPNVTYSGPTNVTHGGTVTGNFKSTDSDVPCIRIQTTEPVIIENCILAGAGRLIEASGNNGSSAGASLIVRNNRGYGLTQSADDTIRARFLEISSGKSLLIEHNYIEKTGGIVVYEWSGNGTAQQTVTIRYNQSLNIDGRFRNPSTSFEQTCNFIGMNGVRNLVGAEIAWNQVINLPFESFVEDNINFYNSGGTAASPALMHDNYIFGSYPRDTIGPDHTGTGFIIDGDSAGGSEFVQAYHNQLVSTCGAGMNIAGGHDIRYYENRVISCSLTADGTRLNANWAACAIFNYYQQPNFYNNTMENNVVGYTSWEGNEPYWNRRDDDPNPNSMIGITGTVHLPDRPLTLADEQAEWTLWQQKLLQNGITVGPGGSTPTVPAIPSGLSAVAGNAQVALSWSAASGATSYKVKRSTTSGGAYTTLASPTATSYTDGSAANGTTYYYVISAVNASGESANSSQVSATPQASAGQTTYGNGGNPWAISGTTRIEAENFDVGGEAVAYSDLDASNNGGQYRTSEGVDIEVCEDTGAGYNVGWTGNGEWLEYTITVPTAGNYNLKLRAARAGNGNVRVLFNGVDKTGTISLPTTGGWQTFADSTTVAVNLGAGQQVMRVEALSDGFNVNWIELSAQAIPNVPPTVSVTSPANGATFTAPASVTINATAADQDGTVTKVEFFQGTTKLGEDTTSPYSFSWTSVAAGSYTLTAKATDNSGATTTSAGVGITVSIPVPAVPSGLSAVASDAQVALSWSASSAAASYKVKRATTSGGPYTTLASPITTSYTDSSATNGTTYYYVISAVNASGESANSSQVSATPQAPAGQITYGNGGGPWTISNGTIRIEAENFDTGGQGVAYSDGDASNNGDSSYRATEGVDVELCEDTGVGYDVGYTGNGEWLEYTISVPTAGNYNLKLRTARTGDGSVQVLFNGTNKTGVIDLPTTGGWQTYADVTVAVSLSAGVQVMRVEMLSDGFNLNWIELSSAVTLPSPWVSSDIGSVGVAGSASYASGIYTIKGSGDNIWDMADAFHFVRQTASGDCSIKAKVTAVQNTDPSAKAGVMIRESLNADSAYVMMSVQPSGVLLQYRKTTGGPSSYTWGSSTTAPYWVRVTRTGNVFKGYVSANGSTWTQLGGNVTNSMGSVSYVGLGVCSLVNTTLNTSTFSNVTAVP